MRRRLTQQEKNKKNKSTSSEVDVSRKLLKEMSILSKGISELLRTSEAPPIRFIQTDLMSLNRAFGIGGVPIGCVGLLHGPFWGGKSSLAVLLMRSFQRRGHFAIYYDAEQVADTQRWFKQLGLNLEGSFYKRPDTLEATAKDLDILINNLKRNQEKGLIDPNRCAIIVIDSINKLAPRDELEILEKLSEKSKEEEGLLKKGYPIRNLLVSGWMDKLTPRIAKSNILLLLLAQERQRLDAKAFQKQYRVKGAESMSYDNTFCLRVQKAEIVEKQEKGTNEYCRRHRITVERNKAAGISFGDADYFTWTRSGGDTEAFDSVRETFEELVFRKLLQKESGSRVYIYVDDFLKSGTESDILEQLRDLDTLKEVQRLLLNQDKQTGIDYGALPMEIVK